MTTECDGVDERSGCEDSSYLYNLIALQHPRSTRSSARLSGCKNFEAERQKFSTSLAFCRQFGALQLSDSV